MNRFVHVLHQLNHAPWLLLPSYHSNIRAVVEARAAMTAAEWAAERRPGIGISGEKVEVPQAVKRDGIMEIPIAGVIVRGATDFERGSGAVSTEEISADIADALADDEVRGILLDIDSPGGMVNGVPELAAEIANAAAQKPVIAFSAGLLTSAAYYLAAGATAIYVTPSSEIGSIGVYLPWLDETSAYAAQGLKVELIKNRDGEFKGAGYPGTALTESQREQLQQNVERIFEMFAAHIAANRRVQPQALRGQTFLGADSVRVGLADELVASRAIAVADLKRLARLTPQQNA